MLDQDIELSDKAKDFTKLFETFQKSKPSGLDMNPIELMKLQHSTNNHGDIQSCTEQILAMEQRILARIDIMERNQNAKLDKILELLNK